jgi:hypothetical protein
VDTAFVWVALGVIPVVLGVSFVLVVLLGRGDPDD